MEMSRLTRDGTAEPVLQDQILRRERGQGNNHFLPCSADHDQDWQPYPVDPYSCYNVMVMYYEYVLLLQEYASTYYKSTSEVCVFNRLSMPKHGEQLLNAWGRAALEGHSTTTVSTV